MLNDFVSGFIGLLLLALSGVGGSATITATPGSMATTTATTTAMASTSVQITDRGFLISLVNALTRYQNKLQKEDRSGKDDHDEEKGEDNKIKIDDSDDNDDKADKDNDGEERKGNDDDDNDEGENEEENENEDEDDDRGGNSNGGAGSGTNGSSAGATGSAGASTNVTFTLGAIASHNTSVSCYSAINGSVYDLTTWIPLHPGGQAAIKGLCGVDGTSAFNGQHGGSRQQAEVLAKYKIGTLVQ